MIIVPQQRKDRHPIAYSVVADIASHGRHRAGKLMPADRRKRICALGKGARDIGTADSAEAELHAHRSGAQFRDRHLLVFKLTDAV